MAQDIGDAIGEEFFNDNSKKLVRKWREQYIIATKQQRLALRKEHPNRNDIYDLVDEILK